MRIQIRELINKSLKAGENIKEFNLQEEEVSFPRRGQSQIKGKIIIQLQEEQRTPFAFSKADEKLEALWTELKRLEAEGNIEFNLLVGGKQKDQVEVTVSIIKL